MTPRDLLILELASHQDWERWLDANHGSSPGVWLKLAKKGAPARTVARAEAVELALCYGWIDGQAAPHDDAYWLQRFTPRGRRSKWSRINRDKAEQLIAEGRMRPSGHAEVEAAKADGRWDLAYEPQSRATVPDDFQKALDRNPVAKEFFATLTGASRYAFLYRLHQVRTTERRAKRIATYISMLEEGKAFHQ